MGMSSDEEEELFDVGLASDHASLINPKEKEDDRDVLPAPVHNKRIFKTVVLFSSFISLGLAVAILGPTIPNLILQVGTGYSQLSFIFLTRGFGYMVGAIIAGFVIERLNPFRVLGCSLALCAVAMFLMPAANSLNLLILLFILAGFSMGCLDTGGNVLCIQIWGPKSPPYMQALHFSFAVGALVAPLVAKPFIGLPFPGNETALDVVCQLGQFETSHSLITEHVDPNTIVSSVKPLTSIPPNIVKTQGFTTVTKPVPTTKQMVPSTEEHIPTAKEQISTTKDLIPTTTKQVPTTKVHVPTTVVPVPTTRESVPTTKEPMSTTKEQILTTKEQISTTTEAVTTKKVPVLTTNEVPTTNKIPTTKEQNPTTAEQIPTTVSHVTFTFIATTESVPTPEPFLQTTEYLTTGDTTSYGIETKTNGSVVTDNPQPATTNHSRNIGSTVPSDSKQQTSIGEVIPSHYSASSPKTVSTTIAKQSIIDKNEMESTSKAEGMQEGSVAEVVSVNDALGISTLDSEGSTVEEGRSTDEESKRSIVKETTVKQPNGTTIGKSEQSTVKKTQTSSTVKKIPTKKIIPTQKVNPPKHQKNMRGKSVKTVFKRDIGWISTGGSTTNKTEESVEGGKLWNVYGIIFFVITLNSIAFFYLSFKGGHYKQSQYCGTNKSIAHQNDRSFRIQLLSIMFVFYFLYVGSEVAFGSFIYSYGRFSDLKLDKDQASLLNSLFWGTFAAFRGFAIILARCNSPLVMLLIDLLGCGVASLILLIFKGSNSLALWAGTAFLGASMASLFPSGFSWLERYIKVTGSAASVLVVGASAGEMAIPFAVGKFFPDWCHPENEGKNIQILMYIMFAVTIFTSIIFLIAYRIAKKKGDRYKGHHLVPESSMMLELQSTD